MTIKEKLELNSYAISARHFFGEDSLSSIDVLSSISAQVNFTIIFYPFSQRISGMCFRIKNDNVIAINSTQTYGRQRFTASHEIYHLLFQSDLSSVICPSNLEGPKDDEERNADTFASYFLMPDEALHNFVLNTLKIRRSSLTINDIVRVEQYFEISRQAVLIRLSNEGLISREVEESSKSNVIESARNAGFDDHLYRATLPEKQFFTIGSHIKSIEDAKNLGKLSESSYRDFLIKAFRSDIAYSNSTGDTEIYD